MAEAAADGALRSELDGARGRSLLLIAVRAPEPGRTKTRLGATIGMARAAELYRAFVCDLAARFMPSDGPDPGYQLGWAFTPADCGYPRILADLGHPPPPPVRFVAQEGDGWGVRQANLLRWAHAHGFARTVLIASDSPQLDVAIPAAAFGALADHDVALGRVRDGGYYLIGMRGFHDILSATPMSTPHVAVALAACCAARGLSLAELPPTFDIDEEPDLRLLADALAPDGAAAPATWAALRRLGLP